MVLLQKIITYTPKFLLIPVNLSYFFANEPILHFLILKNRIFLSNIQKWCIIAYKMIYIRNKTYIFIYIIYYQCSKVWKFSRENSKSNCCDHPTLNRLSDNYLEWLEFPFLIYINYYIILLRIFWFMAFIKSWVFLTNPPKVYSATRSCDMDCGLIRPSIHSECP